MAKDPRRPGRFSRTGHTTHRPAAFDAPTGQVRPGTGTTLPYDPYAGRPPGHRTEPLTPAVAGPPAAARPPAVAGPPAVAQPPAVAGPPAAAPGDGFGAPSYHPGRRTASAPDQPTDAYPTDNSATDAYPTDAYRTDAYRSTPHPTGAGGQFAAGAAAGGEAGGRFAAGAGAAGVGAARAIGNAGRSVTNRIIAASRSGGARESGLTPLIWNQALSYGTDAMITVALAGTVFFGASAHAQRGNVLLYLLVTMAPFAVVAPVIGPALDRLQHGRRWAMAGSAIGRAVLALIMATHPTDLLVLYPCALGSLVLSKGYAVVRAAAAPRLVPPGMTLVEANSRLTIFGLGTAVVGGAVVGGLIRITGSYAFGLVVTAIAFAVCGVSAFRLPPQVDSSHRARRHPEEPPRPTRQQPVPPRRRLLEWARRGFAPAVIVSMQGESALRFLSGLLTIYLAFWVEATQHGWHAAAALSAVLTGAGVGNFLGTAIGARLRLRRPEQVVTVSGLVAAGACLLAALLFNALFAVVAILIASISNSLGKVALDAVIQRDVVETLRTGAFGRSETFLQLAWVVGAAIACLLPASDGRVGMWVAVAVFGAAAVCVALRARATGRPARAGSAPAAGPPGTGPA